MRKEPAIRNSMKASLVRDLVDVLFPGCCHLCQTKLFSHEQHLCRSCLGTLCYLPVSNSISLPFLQDRLNGRITLQHTLAMLKFESGNNTQTLLHSIKYKKRPDLGEYLGELFGQRIRHLLQDEQVILHPVPLFKSKLGARGYNQSELIAKGMAQHLDCPVRTDLIIRTRGTESQTKKSRADRWSNVHDVFQLNAEPPKGHIIFVDDVMTTGATFEAMLRPLEGIASSVSVAALAYAN